MNVSKVYIIKYYGGSYDDYYERTVFATHKKQVATKYVTKFNKTLKKWKEHYSQYESYKYGMKWLDDKYIDTHYDRWSCLRRISSCFWTEVEIRDNNKK